MSDPLLEEFEELALGFGREFQVPELGARELLSRMEQNAPTLLLDARTAAEQSVSILPGAVLTRPMDDPLLLPETREFQKRYALDGAATVQADGSAALPSRPLIVVYCAGGYRSARLIANLKTPLPSTGPPFVNLRGGIIAYANAGGVLRVTPPHERPTVHGYSEDWARYVRPPTQVVLEPPIARG